MTTAQKGAKGIEIYKSNVSVSHWNFICVNSDKITRMWFSPKAITKKITQNI